MRTRTQNQTLGLAAVSQDPTQVETDLDELFLTLLRQVGGGKEIYKPSGTTKEEKEKFTKIVDGLVELQERKLIDINQILRDPDSVGNHYCWVGPCTLTYKGRRLLGKQPAIPAVSELGVLISEQGLDACLRDFDRALASLPDDPGQAIASASSTIESICKAILDRHNIPYPKSENLRSLMDTTLSALDLHPEDSQAGEQLKRLVGGLTNTALAVGDLRTKYSAAHGKGVAQPYVSQIFAKAAVNSMATVGLFFLEYELAAERREK